LEIQIRLAIKTDAAAISTLNSLVQAKHVAAEPWLFKHVEITPEHINALIAKEDAVILVATCNTGIVGYCYAQKRSHPETSLTSPYLAFHIHHICVDPRFRRNGIGRALIEVTRDTAQQMGATKLTADVWDFNAEAKSLFLASDMSLFQLRFWQTPEV
jgi:ribosomal protein S18 acetylase RimI-like enzyme